MADAREILRAGRDGDAARVLALLEADPALARAADPVTGMTPLHQAARHGALPVAQRLLDLGADPGARNRWGLVPLHYAARFGHGAVARLLIRRGADVNARAARGQTPLDWAVCFERWDVAELLRAAGAEVGVFAAAGLGLVDRLAELLDRDPGLVAARNDWGGTPLHVAAIGGRREAARLLLARGADPRARDERGRTPADHARDPVLRALLAEGAAPLSGSPRG